MHLNTRGKRLWIVDETGQATPVKRPADIHQRPRGRHLPDWWVEEKAPDWRPEARGEVSLLRLGMTQNEDAAKRSARRWPGQEEDPGPWDESDDDLGPDPDMAPPAVPAGGPARGMKIGAGHKPQAYDALGRYTGPRGGSMPMGGGPVRLFGAEGLAGEPGGEAPDEPGEGLEATAEVVAEALEQAQEQAEEVAEETAKTLESAGELKGVLLADSGRVVSDAGGGWDNEARRLEEKRFTPERLAQNARADLGSDRWKPIQEGNITKNQCNVFVADKLRESGAPVPNVGGWSGSLGEGPSNYLKEKSGGAVGGHIPSANDWHNGVPGYERVRTERGELPMPGDVAASREHVGIVTGAGKTVSVTSVGPSSGQVVENDWGFRANQKPVTFWRYKVPAPGK